MPEASARRATRSRGCLAAGRRWFAASGLPALGAALLAGLLLPIRTGTGCEGKPLSKGEVRVSVVAILASETCTEIDWRLQCIAKEVQKVHPQLKLKGFRLAKMTCKAVPVRGSETFELAVDQTAAITVLRPANKENKVQLKITPPTLGEITYTVTCGKFLPIITNYQTKNGEWLILAVRVQPCQGKKK